MYLGVFLESPQGSQSSSRVGACTGAFLRAVAAVLSFPSRGSRDLWLSLEAFPRRFSTTLSQGLCHLPPWCESNLFLRYDGNAGNSFPTTQGKDPYSRARWRKRVSAGCGRESRASSRVETGLSRNFLSCSKGVKDPLEVPDVRCD